MGQMRVRHFVQGYPETKNALAEFSDNPNEMPKVQSESNGLYERMCLLETGMFQFLERHTRESKHDYVVESYRTPNLI